MKDRPVVLICVITSELSRPFLHNPCRKLQAQSFSSANLCERYTIGIVLDFFKVYL